MSENFTLLTNSTYNTNIMPAATKNFTAPFNSTPEVIAAPFISKGESPIIPAEDSIVNSILEQQNINAQERMLTTREYTTYNYYFSRFLESARKYNGDFISFGIHTAITISIFATIISLICSYLSSLNLFQHRSKFSRYVRSFPFIILHFVIHAMPLGLIVSVSKESYLDFLVTFPIITNPFIYGYIYAIGFFVISMMTIFFPFLIHGSVSWKLIYSRSNLLITSWIFHFLTFVECLILHSSLTFSIVLEEALIAFGIFMANFIIYLFFVGIINGIKRAFSLSKADDKEV